MREDKDTKTESVKHLVRYKIKNKRGEKEEAKNTKRYWVKKVR